jgi:hypothetical protein
MEVAGMVPAEIHLVLVRRYLMGDRSPKDKVKQQKAKEQVKVKEAIAIQQAKADKNGAMAKPAKN